MSFADQLDVFYGRVTHHSAQIYVRMSSLAGGGEWSIGGHVRGPIAPGTRTLPTTIALQDLGAGASLLGACSVPDPTFWTTQLSSTYEANVQLCREGQVVETAIRSLGIRFFGARGRNFLWEGKRWVLRGVATSVSQVGEIEAFRDNGGVIITPDPAESLLSTASTLGVLLVVELAGTDLLRDLRTLSRWPAVAMVILPSDCRRGSELRSAAPNLLFAQRMAPGKAREPADWAEVILCDATDLEAFGAATRLSPLPVVALRRLNGNFTLVEARRECDRLQRDLVPLGDFAGYVVQVDAPPDYTNARNTMLEDPN